MNSRICIYCGNLFFKKNYTSMREWNARYKCCSRSCVDKLKIGQPQTDAQKRANEKRRKASTGRKHTLEVRAKMSGENSHLWRGGITELNNKIRSSAEYVQWRKSVFERDNYACQECGKRGGELNADHIKPFAYYPELRFELSNGRTLCVVCHRKTDTYRRRPGFKYSKEQLDVMKKARSYKKVSHAVEQIDPVTNEVVNVFRSISKASQTLGGSSGGGEIKYSLGLIKNKPNGTKKETALGFKWKIVNKRQVNLKSVAA